MNILWWIVPFSVFLGMAALFFPRVNSGLHRIDRIDTGYPKGAASEPEEVEPEKPRIVVHSIGVDLNRMNKKRNRFAE